MRIIIYLVTASASALTTFVDMASIFKYLVAPECERQRQPNADRVAHLSTNNKQQQKIIIKIEFVMYSYSNAPRPQYVLVSAFNPSPASKRNVAPTRDRGKKREGAENIPARSIYPQSCSLISSFPLFHFRLPSSFLM